MGSLRWARLLRRRFRRALAVASRQPRARAARGLDFARPAAPGDEVIAERIRAYGDAADAAAVADVRGLIEGFIASDTPRSPERGVARAPRAAVRLRAGATRARRAVAAINGVVDVHAEESDRVLVVDYKTDALQGRDPAARARRSTRRSAWCTRSRRCGRAPSGGGDLRVPRAARRARGRSLHRRRRAAARGGAARLAGGVICGRFEVTDEPHRELCHLCPAQPALCTSTTSARRWRSGPRARRWAAPSRWTWRKAWRRRPDRRRTS